MDNTMTINADWWVPDAEHRFNEDKHTGTLTYNEKTGAELDVYIKPSNGRLFSSFTSYDVIWGEAVGGQIITLFNSVLVRQENFTVSHYKVNYILIGRHVQSLDEPCFSLCVTSFPYLKNWAFEQRINAHQEDNGDAVFHLQMSKPGTLVSTELEEGITTSLWELLRWRITRHTLSAEQATSFNIESITAVSIRTCLNLISEFSQFLSIALFSPQNPSEIKFKNKGENSYCDFLFKQHESFDPKYMSLINYDELKERIPSMLTEWHGKHGQVAPIADYLIRSMQHDTPFGPQDFLIIAQALDGYFKRFVNKRDGKDNRKYRDGIDKLLRHFKDVSVIQECKFDTLVLEQSRDKYTHLIPDDDKRITKASEGQDLFWLTQKCKILLACCILDLLGLSIDEINLCCEKSPLNAIVKSLPIGS